MLKKLYVISLFLCLLFFSGIAQRSKEWQDKNDRGNRFEGEYFDRDIGNLAIDLLSFFSPGDHYVFGEDQRLEVHFYNPDSGQYKLVAKEIDVRQFYWMEDKNSSSRNGWNTFSGWPVDYLLKSLEINRKNLGLLVNLGKPNEKIISPAYLGIAEKSDKDSFKPFYVAHFVLGTSAEKGSWKLYQGKGRRAGTLIQERKLSSKDGSSPFAIYIMKKLLPQSGWYTMELNFTSLERNNSEKSESKEEVMTYAFSFYHHIIE
ncbi:MAG: hypothetical protein R8P61_10035 [Bacteroidia bacterium]|nr:hypothetical protein [Bacteroidia bacterium]